MTRLLPSLHPAINRHSPSPAPLFLSPKAPFPILVPFVFNRLRTLMQLAGGRGYLPRKVGRTASKALPHPSSTSLTSSTSSTSRSTPIFFVFAFLQTLLHQRKPQLFSFQAFPNSFTKTPGVGYPPRNVTLAAPKARPSPSSTSLTSSTSSTSRLSRAMDLYRQEGEYLPSEARHAIGAEQSW